MTQADWLSELDCWFPRSAWEPVSSDALRRRRRRGAARTVRSHGGPWERGSTRGLLLRLGMAAALVATAGLSGCRSKDESRPGDGGRYPRVFRLTSTAFAEGQSIPQKYTGEGADISPPLSWSLPAMGAPILAKEFAVICEDPDAPGGTWVHWVIYRIPAAATGLPENFASSDPRPPGLKGIVQGKNSFGDTGYGGPMPPPGDGEHRYFFRLYALDAELGLESGLDKAAVLEAIKGHILAEGELMGTYER